MIIGEETVIQSIDLNSEMNIEQKQNTSITLPFESNLNVQDKLPLLCLSMIVKNEAHVILETLRSVTKYGIGYYVICDTGSTDDTVKVITEYFDSVGIPGCIKHHTWVKDFGYSRTLALNECIGKSEYIWIIDADDVIVGDLVLPELTDHSYSLQIGSGFTYSRPFIIKNDPSLGWQFKLPLHEYLCSKIHTNESIVIKGNYYLDSRRLGDRSKNPNKYLDDAIILKDYLVKLENDPNSVADYHRCVFYMANSYFDHSNMHSSVENMENALEGYKKRISLGGWYEEVFYSWYRSVLAIRFLMEHNKGLGQKKYTVADIIKAGTQGFIFCHERIESITELVKYFNHNGNYKEGYKYAKMAFGNNFKRGYLELPINSKLFIHENMYYYELAHEFVYAAINQGKYIEAYHVINSTLKQYINNIPNSWVKVFNTNKQLCIQQFKKVKTNACLLYVGNNMNLLVKDVVTHLKAQYIVYLAMDTINRSVLDHNSKSGYFSEGVVFITTDMINEIRKKVKFAQVYLLDNVNLLLHKSKGNKTLDIHTTLIMITEGITAYANDGTSININNGPILSYLSSRINQIVVCRDNSMAQAVGNYYSINPSLIGCIESSPIELFEKKYIKYNFVVNLSDYDAYTSGITLNSFEHTIFPDPYFGSKYFADLCAQYDGVVDQCKDLTHALNYHRMKNVLNNSINITEDIKKVTSYIEENKGGAGCINKTPWNILKVSMLIKDDKYQDALTILNSITKNKMESSFIYPNDTYLEELRSKCLDKLKDSHLIYPGKQIEAITKNLKNSSTSKNIILTMTTCKRLDLLQKTLNSFINTCTLSDLYFIKEWLIVDDNSSTQDRSKMKELYPFITLIEKSPEQKGHYQSMKIIYDYITSNNFEYVIHMEDDFHFIDKKNFISNALKIFENDKSGNYGQVLFNRNYAEILHTEQQLNGGILKYADKIDYIEHEHYKPGTPGYKEFNLRIKGANCMYWPHYSFRPSMIKVNVLKEVGPYTNSVHFEMQYAKEYIEKGYKSVFFNGVNCLHIGKKTWERNVTDTPNAYRLNEQDQFGKSNGKIGINVLTYNKYASSTFKHLINNALDSFNIKANYVNTANFTIGNDFDYKRYNGNGFCYFENVLKYNETILEILQEIKNGTNDFSFILQDTIQEINSNVIDVLISEMNEAYCNSLIILNSDNEGSILQIDAEESKMFSGSSNFIVSKQAATIILDAINTNKHVSDNVCSDFLGLLGINYYKCSALKEKPRDFEISDMLVATHLDGYKFYSKLDSYGGDIGYFDSHVLVGLKKRCDSDELAKGFNTLGWVKHTLTSEESFKQLYKATQYTDGLYVKL